MTEDVISSVEQKETKREDRKWCVYMHTFPNGKKYIGITSTKPHHRWKSGHGYTKECQPVMFYAIQKYGWSNIKHDIIADDLTECEAKTMECELIALYKTNCGKYYNPSYGYNVIDGGEGANGAIRSEETKQKLREIAKARLSTPENNPMYGKHHTEETRNKISEHNKKYYENPKNNPMYGRTWWDENTPQEKIDLWIQHKSEASSGENNPNFGNHWSDEMKIKIRDSIPHTKIVLQFNSNEEIINEYPSIRQMQRETGFDRSGVSKCCQYKQLTCGGFFWMFKSEYQKYGKLIHKNNKGE